MKRSHRILIVEDDPNVRLLFRTALACDEYLVSTAHDGETALRWLKREPIELVLLDLKMPGLGGMEVLRRLREAGSDVPVVIVSAHDCVPNVVEAMRLGATDFLTKPSSPQALRKAVAAVLARHRPLASGAGAARPINRVDESLARTKRAPKSRARGLHLPPPKESQT